MNELRIFIQSFEGGIAGSTNSIAFLAKGLAARGHKIWLGCPPDSRLFALAECNGVTRIPMTWHSKLEKEVIRRTVEIARKEQIHIINAQASRDRYSSMWAVFRYNLPVKLVHTRRQRPLSAGGFLQRQLYVKGTDAIVTVSEQLRRTFIAKGYPPHHLHTIFNGTPAERYSRIDEDTVARLRLQFGLSDNQHVVGCISRMKEQEQLVAAGKYLPPDIVFFFAGIPQGSLDDAIKRHNIPQRVVYAGVIDPEEILPYYRLCSVNVLPSIMDGFGLVLVEAMALGVPVIGTNAQGIPDVINHGTNGFLFDNGNVEQLAAHIRTLLADNPTRERFIDEGKKTALQRFSLDNTLTHYENFFSRLLSQPNNK